jgi:hypothetical protein
MQQQRQVSLWLVTLVACGSSLAMACGDDLGDGTLSDGSTAGSAGSGAGMSAGGSSAGLGGTPGAGGSMGVAGTPGAGGSVAIGGGGSGAGGSSGGSSGGPSGSSAGSGGMSGGSGGGSGVGPFGIVSCQPKFETACKPPIEFVNGDPNGRGKVFTNVIPDVEATMKDIACTVCSILYRDPSEIPNNKHPSKIRLVLDDHGGVAQAGGDQIQFDLNYINGYANRSMADTLQEMKGVLQHETTHLYQNYGTGGTGEGMADVVRTRGGYYPRSRWQPGGSWKTPYTDSGFFYSWLTGPCAFHSEHYEASDFDLPYKINKILAGKNGDSASFDAVDGLLQDTFGKGADELWSIYQDTAF